MLKSDDVSPTFKENGRNHPKLSVYHDTMKLMSSFLGECPSKYNNFKVKPSVYLKEMLCNTEERIDHLTKLAKYSLSYNKGVQPSFFIGTQKDFKIIPPIIVFQSFLPGKPHSATLTISNISEVSKQLTTECEPSPVFSVSYLSKVSSKLAPGMSLHFLVKFIPHLDQDYQHTFTFKTDNHSFDISLIGLSSRPLVNFPDTINLKETIVKIQSNKTFYVKNIGNVPAVFNMICEKPFSVNPERCILDVEKIAMITVSFKADSVNDFFKHMVVRFEKGEQLFIELTGSSRNGNIWLDPNKVQLDDTYLGLKCQHSVTLYNDSNSVIKFCWQKFESLKQDLDELNKIREGFDNVRIDESIRCNKLEYNEVISEDDHSKVYSRIYLDEVQLLSPNNLLFANTNFQLSPLEGELWPGGRCSITVTFSPLSSGDFSCNAFCEVTGRDTRLPLLLSGKGLGPNIKFSLRSLDIGPVFLGSNQAYEILAANKGDIPGSIQFTPTPTIFGGSITCDPEFQCLKPYEIKSFIISFSSSRTGSFVEDLFFKVEKSGEDITIMIKGSVVNPTISFESNKLDFGVVPVGFPRSQTVNLINQSQVPVAFALKVPGDGEMPPVSWDMFAAASSKPALPQYCNEFTLSPDTGVIDSNSSVAIEVTLLANAARKHSCCLVAENKNSKLNSSLSLAILYEAQVARIDCDPSEMVLRFCFINYNYTLEFTLTNSSSIPLYFFIPPQRAQSINQIIYKTSVVEELLQPGESVQMIVDIILLVVGKTTQDIMVLLFGQSNLESLCSITCSAQGPNVSSNVEALDFGKMTLMETRTQTFDLSNDSPTSASFTIYAEEKHQIKWEFEPCAGQLQPGETTSVRVTLTVVDPGNISSTLHVHVEDSRPLAIALFAFASGCGIVIDPSIFPEIDLGFLFSRRLYQFTLKLSNPGSRHHFIQFVDERMSVRSGSICSVVEMEVNESFYCWAVINKKGLKQVLGNVLVKAIFIAPVIELSEESLEFEINVGPYDSQGQTCLKTLKLKSIAYLPITIVLDLNFPFMVYEDESSFFYESIVHLEPDKEAEIKIGFKPSIQENLQSTVYSSVLHIRYQEHPEKDKIQLKGQLNFPNLKLSQHILDFGCVPLNFQDHKEIIMMNPTPLPVTYHFVWEQNSIITSYLEKEEMKDIMETDLPDYLKLDPLYNNRLLPTIEHKDSLVGPLPLVYVEPIPDGSAASLEDFDCEEADDVQEEKEILDILFPVIEPYFYPEEPSPEFNILPKERPSTAIVSKVFDLAPMFGTLAPFQSQVLNVAFQPQSFMGVVVTAVCSVLGGPTATIRLSGQSARHIYTLSTTFINFGFRTFLEPCEETIKLNNMSQLPFNFKIISNSPSLLMVDIEDVEVSKLTVEPPYGVVEAQSSVTITVKFFPGLSGEFQQMFMIQVSHLEPVTVVVTGHGVLPQVSINQLKISKPKIPIGWMYTAVASLTAKRFKHFISGRYTPDLTISNDASLDWVFIDYSDRFPSNDDIWLAIERVIAWNNVKDNPHIFHSSKSVSQTIPQLVFPGYTLDFGSVVVGTTREATITIENKGMVRCDAITNIAALNNKLKHDYIYINCQSLYGLPVGRSVPLFITMKPSPQRFKSIEESLSFTLYLQVVGGASIPINVKALFTIPHIYVDQNAVDFGNVQCGKCLKVCILLKNRGEVEAECTAHILNLKPKKYRTKDHLEKEMPFFINKNHHFFSPKSVMVLEIGFLPKEERSYEAVLKLKVKHRTKKIIIHLQGSGVEPKIDIFPEILEFGSRIPYSKIVQKSFSVTNKSPFSITLYFPDFDSEIIEEDRILRVLTNLYNSDRLLLPLESYNGKMLHELKDLYRNLINEANMKLNAEDAFSLKLSGNRNPISTIKSMKQSINIFGSNPESTLSLNKMSVSLLDQFLTLSPDEEETLLHNYIIDFLNTCSDERDPLNLKERNNLKPLLEANDPSKGILIVFHGAPKTDYLYWANRTANLLSLTIKTLDELILEEAATSLKLSAIQVQEAVSKAYIELSSDEESVDQLSQENPAFGFDELCNKVKYIRDLYEQGKPIDSKNKVIGKRKGPKSVSSKAGSRPQTGQSTGTTNKKDLSSTFGDISIDVFTELLRERLFKEVQDGLVLESTTGFFIRNLKSALSLILKCVGHIKCLKFFSLYNSIEQYLAWEKLYNIKEDVKKKSSDQEKKALFHEMTAGQISDLPEADKLLFEETFISERKHLMNLQNKEALGPALPPKSNTGSKKSKIRSIGSTIKAKEMKTSIKNEDKNQKSDKNSAQSSFTKSSKVKRGKSQKIGEDQSYSILKEAFSVYEDEIKELIVLLSCWNTEHFEFDDKPSSLFSFPNPKSRKDKLSVSKNSRMSSRSVHDKKNTGVSCNIIRIPFNPENSRWFDELIIYFTTTKEFMDSKKMIKDWDDIKLPGSLYLSSIIKPDVRIQNANLGSFYINNNKEEEKINKLFQSVKTHMDDGSKENLEESTVVNRLEVNASIHSTHSKVDHNLKTIQGEKDYFQAAQVISRIKDDFEIVATNSHESKTSSSKNSIESEGTGFQSSSVLALKNEGFVTRLDLNPGEQISWKVSFEPIDVAVLKQEVKLEIGGWRKVNKILLSATCDLPRIDSNPRAMFEKVQETMCSATVSNCVYLLDKKLFYFGPVFATSANKNRTNDVSTNFYFTNISAVDVRIELSFLVENAASDLAFGFNPKHLQISPGETQDLEVFAFPKVVGKYSETLVYSILNNPEPGFIKMSCHGIKSEFEIDPKVVSFERVLLYRKEICQLTLTNKSYKPLGWRLVGLPMLSEQISVNQQSGVIPALQSDSVLINFYAQQVEVSTNIVFIEVYDDQFRGEPFLSEPVQVNIESVDVLVDITFPKAKSSEVKFGDLKVGQSESQTIVLKNKGKYDVNYEIKYNDLVVIDFDPAKVFLFQPKSGVLPKSGKPVNVKISCLCARPLHLSRVPLFKVLVVDSGPMDQPVAAIPVNVTVNAYKSQYKVHPESELNFGPLMVGATKVEPLTIQNIGNFEFDFQILTLEQDKAEILDAKQEEMKSTKSSKLTSTKTKEERKKVKVGKVKSPSKKGVEVWPSLEAGEFTLSHSGGRVQPGELFTISVTCSAQQQNSYSQEIVIRLLDFPLIKKKGTHIILKADCFLPHINFDNVSFIFQEATSLPCGILKEGDSHVLYDKDENVLRFINVCVGEAGQSIKLHLDNQGLVTCDVTLTVSESAKQPVFTVTPDKLTIMPHTHSEFTVLFLPTQIGVSTEELQVQVSLPSGLKPQQFITTLIGEAFLPQISVTKPPPNMVCELSPPPRTLLFTPTLVGDCREEVLVFENTGVICCTVIIEILGNKDKLFSFSSLPDSTDSTRSHNKDLQVVRLVPREKCELAVTFCPKKTAAVSCQVKLYITNNPYEDQMIVIEGVGFMQDVVIDGIPISKDHKSSFLYYRSEQHPLKYQLKFAPCGVGETVKKVITLKNQTQNFLYRFSWNKLNFITISPSVGHLPPGFCKEILFSFQSNQPETLLNKVEVLCLLTQIQLKVPKSSETGWDNSKKFVKWLENTADSKALSAMKELCVQEEPEFEELLVSSSSLAVLVSACADFAKISYPIEQIIFPSTIIQQVEERNLVLSNTGLVPAVFSWELIDQSCESVGEASKASYGAVSLSSERPRVQLPESVNKGKTTLNRPATCPSTRPCPIPSSVALLSQDDLTTKQAVQRVHYKMKPLPWSFSIEPVNGTIPPNEQLICIVKFQPTELSKYTCKLHLRVENEKMGTETTDVRLEGSSMLPCCHLVVPDCSFCCDPDSYQIYFKTLGVGKPVYKSISVVNTTCEDYNFYWSELTEDQLSPFSCSTPYSLLRATKYLEVIFAFIPKEAGTFKSIWKLSIPERHIKQQVQLIGSACEPNVSMLPTFIHLHPTIIDVRSKGEISLINSEDCDLKYYVDANSLHCGTWNQIIHAQPMKGLIPAQGETAIKVWLTPSTAGTGRFQVRVFVQMLKTPLKLDLIAECYQVQPLLAYQDFNKAIHHMSSDSNNSIDLGVLESRIPVTLHFTLTNVGKPAFHYHWLWDSQSQLSICATNTSGIVSPQSKQMISLQITPLARVVFSQLRLQIVISKGPTFKILLSGSASQPMFRFSFENYDFGPSFVQSSDVEYYKTSLVFSNTDEKPLLLEGEFGSLPPHLRVGLLQTTVQPRSELVIPVTFLPRACQPYSDTLLFLVDGTHRHKVTFKGRGVDLNVLVVNASDKLINLEGVQVGKSKKQCLQVMNKSEAMAYPVFSLKQPVAGVSLSPENPVKLNPNQASTLTVTFSPTVVVKGIQQELWLEFQDIRKVLSVVKASSVGISVRLDREFIPFGSTIIGSTSTSKLMLKNEGDLAVKFSWTVENDVFSLKPQEGFCAAGTDVTVTATYTPDNLQAEVKCQAVCTVSNFGQLKITLSGCCVDLPPPTLTIPLSCPVRQTTSTQIPIFNKFGQTVTLPVSVSGEYFYGDQIATIAPYGTYMFEITYSPLALTVSPQLQHRGTALLYFVDGSCTVYALEGSTGPPVMTERLFTETFTHTPHSTLVPVHNWLQTPQKFHVTHNLEQSSVPNPRYKLSHSESFIVSGSQTRDLSLELICRQSGTLTFKVTLTNELTGESCWYESVFEVKPCLPLGDISLTTAVRRPIHHELMVYNPLDTAVTLNCEINALGVSTDNTPLTLDPLTHGKVDLKYLPLWPCERTTTLLELVSAELGVLPYHMHTTALPPPPEPHLPLSCYLGLSTKTHFTLCNPTNVPAHFECTSSNNDVTVERLVVVPPNDCKTVDVFYQPSSIANISAELTAISSQAGTFIFQVIGTCYPPEPRGPYTLQPGSSETVIIKNVLKDTHTFVWSVNNAVFFVKETSTILKPNEVAEIRIWMVDLDELEFSKYPVTGKLTVSIADPSLCHIKWDFYLRGMLHSS